MNRHGWLVTATLMLVLLILGWVQPAAKLLSAPADGLPHQFVYGVDCSYGDHCWFATWGGIAVFDAGTSRFTSFTPSNSNIAHKYTHDVAVDSSGYVWVGLHDKKGVSLLDHNGTLDNRGDDTWITFTEPDDLPAGHTWVEDIAIDSQGRLWFGHSLGASRLDHNGTPFIKGDDTWVDFSNAALGLGNGFVNAIFEDDGGCMWFGGDGGLSNNCDPPPVIDFPISCAYCCWDLQWLGLVWDIAQDQQGNIWVADGSCGAAKLSGSQWSVCDVLDPNCPIPTNNDGSDNGVRSIEVDPDNNIWFGTRGKGVAVLRGADNWRRYEATDNDWLGSNDIEDIDFSTAGAGWFGTSNGAYLFPPPPTTSAEITPADGGEVIAPDGQGKATFPVGSVSEVTKVTWLSEKPIAKAGQFATYVFDLYPDPVTTFNKPYTLTVEYSKASIGPAKEDTLGLYWWDGGQWAIEPTSNTDTTNKLVTASPDHMSLFAVIGEVEQIFLPMTLR